MFEKEQCVARIWAAQSLCFSKTSSPPLVTAITASLSHYGVMKPPLYGGDMIQLIDL